MTDRQRVFLLISILFVVVAVSGGIGISLLYRTAIREATGQLVELARSQARMVEASAAQARLTPGADAAAATEALIRAAMARIVGAHRTSDFRFARQEAGEIVFIAGQSGIAAPDHLPLDTPLAEPTRRALSGESGSCIGLDLRGVTVLAAFEPIAGLGWSVVAKTDLAEIQQPFLAAGCLAGAVSLLLAGLGGWWFWRLNQPMLDRLRDSEERLQRAVHLSPFPLLIHNEDGRVVMASQCWYEISGYTPAQLPTTAAWAALAYRERSPTMQARIQQEYDLAGRVDNGEFEITTADGGKRTWHFSATPLGRGADGKRLVISAAVDVTERKQAEAALRETKAILQAALDHSVAGIAIADAPDGRLRYVNRAGLLIRDATADVAVKEVDIARYVASWRILHLDGTPYEADEVPLARAIRYGEVCSKEFIIRRDSDEDRIVWANAAPIRDGQGAVTAGIVVFLDVTERQRAEAEVLRLNASLEERVRERTAELEAANRELEAFSYSVSHDLRSPLRSIAGFSTALEEDCRDRLDANGLHHLAVIRRETQHMGELIDDLLRLSRLTRAPLAREDIDLSAIAHTVGETLRAQHPGRDVALLVAPGLRMKGDVGMLRIVFENLLDNAWKFTARRASAQVTVAALPDGKPGFLVRDDGVGFDMAYADRLFGAFQRLHSQADFPGTGIGLATVARIVRRLGGSVRAEAAPERGATFFVSFPPA